MADRMSTPEQEARALEAAWVFLLGLSSGQHPARPITDLRAEARTIAKHYPLLAGERWLTKHDANTNTTVNTKLGSNK